MITVWCSLIVAIILLLVDQTTKQIVVHYMSVGDSYTVIDGLFSFEYVQNKGAAFGMLQNFRLVFIFLTLSVVVLALLYLLRGKIRNKFLIWSFSLIISGGVGNMIDRILNPDGFVIDFFKFEFSWFPYVFNVADICVTFGGAILIVYLAYDLIKGLILSKKSLKSDVEKNEQTHN